MTSAGEQLEITLVKPSPPGWIMMSPEDGRIMGKPKLTDVGLVPVQILVKDDDDATDILSFTLDIRDAQTVTFSWLRPVTRVNGDAISAEELAHYEVTYRKVGGDGTVVNVAKTETSFTSPKLMPGTYEFSIKVIDFWGLNSATTEPVKAEVN
ncbi:MAG: fibronectin type III domain-containing protein [Burkholderiales bacterium]|nr:fibronectin type III domain-containing protein [Burkholderiales bacterium]